MNVTEAQALADRIRSEMAKTIVGQASTGDLLLIALLARGHVLLEGPPGAAKTLMAQTFARTLGVGFGRIQFTPDLMPGDIIGSNIFNFQTSAFTLTRGPIFCDLLLADETMPAAQGLGVLGRVGVVGGHVLAHDGGGVAGDVEAGADPVLHAHADHGFGADAVPSPLLAADERLDLLDIVLVRHGLRNPLLAGHPPDGAFGGLPCDAGMTGNRVPMKSFCQTLQFRLVML